jgi:hypothetical protein
MIILIRRTLFIEDTFILEQWTVQYDVEIDINTCITTSPMGRAMIHVTMLVNTFKTDFILLGMACAWPYQSQYAE